MADLKEDYLDDVLDVTKNTQRRYRMVQNEDGTVSFEDVTDYSQIGDSFGAKDVNAINEAINGLSETIGYSSKNLLDCSGLVEDTINGVTFTPVYDANGLLEYIEVNGTASANTIYNIVPTNSRKLTAGTYIISGCPDGASDSSFIICGVISGSIYVYNEEITKTYDADQTIGYIAIQVYVGYTAENLRFYPMFRKAEIEDPTYEPYYKVEGLRDKVVTLEEYISNLTNGNEVEY